MESTLIKPVLKSKFSKDGWAKLHFYIARILSLVLTYYWYLFAIRSDFESYEQFEFHNLAKGIPYTFVLFNLGLWLSTTQWSRRHKFLVSFLLLPSLIASPAMVGMDSSFFGWVVFGIAVWSYYSLWRNENEH